MAINHENLDERMLHRMLFFTDAVFAIVMTLLVLELATPEPGAANAEALRHAAPHIGAFAFSFFIAGVFWTAHMNITRNLAHFDWLTAIANLASLLPVCLLPYATAWFGADLAGDFSWAFYCCVLVVCSVGNILLVSTAYRGRGRLIAGGSPPGELRYRLVRASIPGVSFLIGLGLLAAGHRITAHFCWVLIPILFGVARILKPKPATVTA
jgi:uncharacterized membrane protein